MAPSALGPMQGDQRNMRRKRRDWDRLISVQRYVCDAVCPPIHLCVSAIWHLPAHIHSSNLTDIFWPISSYFPYCTMSYHQFATRAIHVGSEPDPSTGAVVPCLSVATTFKQDGINKTRVSSLCIFYVKS